MNRGMIKAVFLDLDNTLVTNEIFYQEAQASFRGFMAAFGVKPEETERVWTPIDKELFKTYGYSRKRLGAGFEATLKHFVPDADAEMVETVHSFAEKVFNSVGQVKNGVAEAIDLLTERYHVYIVTAGPKDVQEMRIEHLPFKSKLTGSFIVDRKDKKLFEDILSGLGLKPEETVMMGDSLKSDVIPAVAAGMEAVLIEELNSHHETASDFPAERAYKFSSLLEATRHMIKYETPAAPILLPPPKKNPPVPKFN